MRFFYFLLFYHQSAVGNTGDPVSLSDTDNVAPRGVQLNTTAAPTSPATKKPVRK
jgi:hypothetical protein